MAKIHFRPKTKPFPHQAKVAKRAVKQGNLAIFMDPRTGKTKTALDAAAMQAILGKVKRVLVICPLIAIDVWDQQLWEHFSLGAVIAKANTNEKSVLPWQPGNVTYPNEQASRRGITKVGFYLINYDLIRWRKRDRAKWKYPWVDAIEQWSPDLIILDESHRAKRAGSVTAQSIWRLVSRLREARGDGQPFVYLLTGTPNPKGYIDLFAQFRIMDDSIFGTAKAQFEDHYCEYGFGKRKWQVIRYRNKQELMRKVKENAAVVSAKDAGLANHVFWQDLKVELPPTARRVYNDMAEDLVAEIEGGESITAANAAVRRTRLLQITGGYTTDGVVLHQAKLETARAWLESLIYEREQFVVYARFLPEVRALTKAAKEVGAKFGTITGETPRATRSAFINRFQQRKLEGLIFQPQAGHLAIELTAGAEVVFYSLPDSWEVFYQCYNRALGPKQLRPVRVTIIQAVGTLDVSVRRALRDKRDMHAELMRSPKGFLYGL